MGMTKRRFLQRADRFSQDEDGGILAFVLVLFIVMVVGSGMAVDFMRHETARADLQNALDRGVLAAAALSQTAVVDDDGDGALFDEYEELIGDYMDSRSFITPMTLTVDEKRTIETLNSRAVAAEATYNLKTFFLRIIGLDTMKVTAFSEAKQARNDIEISLVLDISGSMFNPDNSITTQQVVPGTEDQEPPQTQPVPELRATIMKREAKNFVKLILDADTSPLKNRRSINLVPYSHQVALLPSMAASYAWDGDVHNFSYCADFDAADYGSVAVNPNVSITRFQQFRLGWNRSSQRVYTCSRSGNEILPAQGDVTALQNAIDALSEEWLTSVYQGMKWGAAMLDPTARPVITNLLGDPAAGAVVDNKFAGLPRDYGGQNMLKVVVLMSDGKNTWMPRLRDDIYGASFNVGGIIQTESEFWAERDPRGVYTVSNGRGGQRWRKTSETYQGNTTCDNAEAQADVVPGFRNYGEGCANTFGSLTTYDSNNSFSITGVDADGGVSEIRASKTQFASTTGLGSTITQGDARLYEICEAAKAQGIVVYTIGFEAEASANRALYECASGERFYAATGINLGEVFVAIAEDIEQLKLTN
ncbi:MAG: pilus assembly protein TadG-related protein [Pseudomonadota bacterium]